MATIKSTAAAFANQKLVYASSFANFLAKAAELHPSGTGAVSGEEWKSAQNPFYNSVVYTGDGYVVTHGVAIKAAVDNNAGGDGEVSGVVGVSINGQKLTVSVGDDTATATLPVVALAGNDNIGVTNTNGSWEIKLKEVDVTEETETGEGSVEVSEVTVDDYGRVSKVKTVAFDIDKVKVDATKKSGKLIVGEAGTGYLGASDITIDGKNLTVGTLTAEAITLNGEALDSAMSKAHEELEKKVNDEVASLNASISSVESKLSAHEKLDASISQKGHVLLSNSASDSETLAATPKAVKAAAEEALNSAKEYADKTFSKVAESMEFKGGATVSDLNANLTSAENGDTYKATTKGKLSDGQAVEIGDMVIAHVEGSTREWVVVQANLDGAVTSTDTLTAGRLVVGAGNQGVALAAAGTSGQVLKSTGSGIQWDDEVKNRAIQADGAEVLAEGSTGALNIIAGENVELEASTGKITINAEDTTYAAGEGITISGSNNEVKINKATASTLGGVKVGYTESGNNHAVKVDTSGNAYVEVDATITAGEGIAVDGRQVKLATHGTANTYGANSGSNVTSVVIPKITTDSYGRVTVTDQTVTIKDTTYNTATADAAGLIKATVATGTIAPTVNDSTNRSVQVNSDGVAFVNVAGIVVAGTGVSVSGNTVSIKTATTDTIGGVKVSGVTEDAVTLENVNARVGEVASGGYYGVNVDKNGLAFVNVPWVNSWRDVKVADASINLADLEFGADFALNNGKVELTWYTI